MYTRTILIFPQFENLAEIDGIRQKYDPLATCIRPHITLVFPFQSAMQHEELAQILEHRFANIHPFDLELAGFSKSSNDFGNYLLLNVVKGAQELQMIHNVLYEREFQEFDAGYPYTPHMTVGKLPTVEALEAAYREVRRSESVYRTTIHTISMEMIGEHQESIIVYEKELK